MDLQDLACDPGDFLAHLLGGTRGSRDNTKFNGRWRHRVERTTREKENRLLQETHKLCLSKKVLQQTFATYCSKQEMLGLFATAACLSSGDILVSG